MKKISISKFSYKKIITSSLVLMFILFSGLNTHNNISAQMPQMPPSGMMGMMGMMATVPSDSQCRTNQGTGEVFCELNMDVSMMTLTHTSVDQSYYPGQGIWFQGCMLPGQQYENFEAAWIERDYTGTTDHRGQQVGKDMLNIFIRGNMPTQPGQQSAKCKYQFFTSDSPLVQPGQPYHNPQWESDQETQRMFEEADRIRRDADRQRAEEELLRAKQQAELELQQQEEQRKRDQQQQQQQGGFNNIFGQGPVGNIFSNAFQPPPDEEVPQGPFINLTVIAEIDRWKTMECIGNTIQDITGMNYEQAYMDFAFPLGVRMLNEPDFYYDAVTNCMHLSFDKLLSGTWGPSGGGKAPRREMDQLLQSCIVPHLTDTLNLRPDIIMEDVVNVESGKRSMTREEMLAAYDCFVKFDEDIRNNNSSSPPDYFPLNTDFLASFVYGDQEIPGQACMIDSISDSRGMNRQDAERIVGDLVNFAVGRSDQWGFLESDANPQHKNDVVNRVVGCNQDLEWIRDYQASISGGGVNLEDIFARLAEPDFQQCVKNEYRELSDGNREFADTMYDQMIEGFMMHQDPTEIINRPLSYRQTSTILDCAEDFGTDQETFSIIQPYLAQYTVDLDQIDFSWSGGMGYDQKSETLIGCIDDSWHENDRDMRNIGENAEQMVFNIFDRGGSLNALKPLNRDYTQDEFDDVVECLEERPEFDWISQYDNPNYDFEPLFESDLFTQSNVDFTGAAADFRQNIENNNPDGGNSNMVSGSLMGGGALENLRLEMVNLSRGSAAEDCMIANLAREKGETENYIQSSYIGNLIWEPVQRPSKKEKIALENCDSQIRTATQGKGGLNAFLKYGSSGDPDYFAQPTDSQRACMVNEYKKVFGYMIESQGGNPDESAAKAVAEISMPGSYKGAHPILGDSAPNLRPPSAIELEALSNCKIIDLYVFEGSKLRKLIPGVDTSELPIGDLVNNPSNLAILGIMITLFFSVLQMVRGK